MYKRQGLFGKGIGNATQSTHGFLPEAPTDFIFCVLAEEFGFVEMCIRDRDGPI